MRGRIGVLTESDNWTQMAEYGEIALSLNCFNVYRQLNLTGNESG